MDGRYWMDRGHFSMFTVFDTRFRKDVPVYIKVASVGGFQSPYPIYCVLCSMGTQHTIYGM